METIFKCYCQRSISLLAHITQSQLPVRIGRPRFLQIFMKLLFKKKSYLHKNGTDFFLILSRILRESPQPFLHNYVPLYINGGSLGNYRTLLCIKNEFASIKRICVWQCTMDTKHFFSEPKSPVFGHLFFSEPNCIKQLKSNFS